MKESHSLACEVMGHGGRRGHRECSRAETEESSCIPTLETQAAEPEAVPGDSDPERQADVSQERRVAIHHQLTEVGMRDTACDAHSQGPEHCGQCSLRLKEELYSARTSSLAWRPSNSAAPWVGQDLYEVKKALKDLSDLGWHLKSAIMCESSSEKRENRGTHERVVPDMYRARCSYAILGNFILGSCPDVMGEGLLGGGEERGGTGVVCDCLGL